MNIQEELQLALSQAIENSFGQQISPDSIHIERPKRENQGDFSTNVAMQSAKILHQNPRAIAQKIVESLNHDQVESLEVAGPGFINFTLKKDRFADVLNEILDKQEEFGSQPPKDFKVDIEYVSANPTGSLHLGHARGAAWGDSLARILKKAGYQVTREYYVNDAGNQITNLALSLQARYKQAHGLEAEIGKDGYLGSDIELKGKELAKKYPEIYLDNLSFFRKEGVEFELDKIRKDLDRYRVHFDVWSSEQDIRDAGGIEKALDTIGKQDLLYEEDGALWFAASRFGDDKDRVLRKQDGSYTYLVPDIAYHQNKYDRGYDLMINLFGADHHGYIPRLKASIQAMGYDPDKLEVDIIQMVRLVENGNEVKMSKRLGNATTINELMDWVGEDAARYFFVERALNSHLDFDLALARTKSNENPVYYAQYAHARMSSILRNAPYEIAESFPDLTHPKEIELLKRLAAYPQVIEDIARTRQVHRLTNYIQQLASDFHAFYNACKVIDTENEGLSRQRLALVKASQTVLKDALSLIGIEAPESM